MNATIDLSERVTVTCPSPVKNCVFLNQRLGYWLLWLAPDRRGSTLGQPQSVALPPIFWHIGAKRNVLWPSKCNKMGFRPGSVRTLLREFTTLPQTTWSAGEGRGHPSHTPILRPTRHLPRLGLKGHSAKCFHLEPRLCFLASHLCQCRHASKYKTHLLTENFTFSRSPLYPSSLFPSFSTMLRSAPADLAMNFTEHDHERRWADQRSPRVRVWVVSLERGSKSPIHRLAARGLEERCKRFSPHLPMARTAFPSPDTSVLLIISLLGEA